MVESEGLLVKFTEFQNNKDFDYICSSLNQYQFIISKGYQKISDQTKNIKTHLDINLEFSTIFSLKNSFTAIQKNLTSRID